MCCLMQSVQKCKILIGLTLHIFLKQNQKQQNTNMYSMAVIKLGRVAIFFIIFNVR